MVAIFTEINHLVEELITFMPKTLHFDTIFKMIGWNMTQLWLKNEFLRLGVRGGHELHILINFDHLITDLKANVHTLPY